MIAVGERKHRSRRMSALTSMQTVLVEMPSSELEFQTMELRPSLPVGIVREDNSPICVRKENGNYVTWFYESSETVVEQCMDGTIKTWFSPPSLAEVFQDSGHEGRYYRFHSDGSVTSRWDGVNYYWSPETYPTIPVVGELVNTGMYSDGNDYVGNEYNVNEYNVNEYTVNSSDC